LGNAYKTPVVAGFIADNNALALEARTTAHGRAGQHHLVFGAFRGVSTARDASVVTHERGHALLYSLGFMASSSSQETWGIHEGYSDYLSAARRGDPVIGDGLGVAWVRRDLSVRKVWPQNGGESHSNGWIYGGALWDARKALGATAMDRLAFATVPLFHGSSTLLEGRDATLQADRILYGGKNEESLKQHFANHGIGREQAGKPPTFVAENLRPKILPRQDPMVFTLVAEDPDGKSVSVSASALEFVKAGEPKVEGAKTSIEFTVSYDAAYAGIHELIVVAVDADGDRAVQQIPLYQFLAKQEEIDVTYTVGVGETEKISLGDLVPEDDRELYRGGDFWLSGDTADLAHLRRGRLVIAPKSGDEGLHTFTLRGNPEDAGFMDTLQVNVKVLVGDGPRIRLKRGTNESDLVPVGQHLSVHAGSSLDLDVVAFWELGSEDMSGTQSFSKGERTFIALEAPDAPDGVTLTVEPLVPATLSWSYAKAKLIVQTEATQQPGPLTLRIKGTRSDGKSTTRVVIIDVLPGADPPPTLDIADTVVLENGQAEVEFSAADPEGKGLRVEVAHDRTRCDVLVVAEGDTQRGATDILNQLPSASTDGAMKGKLTLRWLDTDALKDAEGDRNLLSLVVRAIDAEGMQTTREVVVSVKGVAKAPDDEPTDNTPTDDTPADDDTDEWTDDEWTDADPTPADRDDKAGILGRLKRKPE
jgi:hypothetical protein